jgi:hypothetical protein
VARWVRHRTKTTVGVIAEPNEHGGVSQLLGQSELLTTELRSVLMRRVDVALASFT